MKKIIKRLSQTILNRLKSTVDLFSVDRSETGLTVREQTQLITNFSPSTLNIRKPTLIAQPVTPYSIKKGRMALRNRLKTKRQSSRDEALRRKNRYPNRNRLGFSTIKPGLRQRAKIRQPSNVF
ncbi:hypothetical protein [Endozoicomonas sp. 8E]|uniref:hypothetical protein n=1 Tax=Endozoicomonas sp. 8E TaxID=3035692 RepID=UPI0029392FC2|nr:hypothetical protein [Endozoicomonas sp. 8E]WOG28095.1 hypothetical protein P6910_00110 [Endozoicomonas sp. 8E]